MEAIFKVNKNTEGKGLVPHSVLCIYLFILTSHLMREVGCQEIVIYKTRAWFVLCRTGHSTYNVLAITNVIAESVGCKVVR